MNGPVQCPVRGKETNIVETAEGPVMNVTGCIDDQSISSMKVNEKGCGTSTAGYGFNAYPWDYDQNQCKLGFISGRALVGTDAGELSHLYFWWKC